MRLFVMVLGIALVLGSGAAGQDLGNRASAKTPGSYPVNIPGPTRQGGDTIATATVIAGLPYSDDGTTAGFTDDYDGMCGYDAGAPDVVYQLVAPEGVTAVSLSLCGSDYDTVLYVLDADLRPISCNDDYCGLCSQLDHVPLTPGETYYIVVDGYGLASGNYSLTTDPGPGCILNCPPAGVAEFEPDLVPNYVDLHNGGCNTSHTDPPLQTISGALPGSDIPVGAAEFCGENGWYLDEGVVLRDTDWFIVQKGSDAVDITVTADAEYESYVFELAPHDCHNTAVVGQATAGPCAPATLTIDGPAGDVWLWVGPTTFVDPYAVTTYDYVLWFTGLAPEVVPTEAATWSTVKALYR